MSNQESQGMSQPAPGSAPVPELYCPNCNSVMPSQMRFCRTCGYRLGEGVEDYTATVRLPGTAEARAGKFGAQGFGQIPTAGPMAVQGTTPIGTAGTDRDFQRWCRKRRRSRWNWMIWVIMIFAFMSVSGGLL